jgi:tetratricopeptide (TPR) repeat protein/predicted Ser/Thr protein kinase
MTRSPTLDAEATELGEPTDAGGPRGEPTQTDARLEARVATSEVPVKIGAHRLVRKLGAGAMGEVYLAHDDELDRPLAIKLIHSDLRDVGHHAERMRREAKALAKLAHPNVVHVYEVGAHEGRVFLAMEYIEGQSLGDWIRRSSPRWDKVLEAYLFAGEGLVAAHAAGLIHRDFKPDNVLFGNDGRICVADFGLAVTSSNPSELDSDRQLASSLGISSSSGTRTLDDRLSVTGAVVGTPSYMPLEQVRGGALDARTDQFAFCVALYEGLWRAKPFGEHNLMTRINALIEDNPIAPPRGEVPSWVWPIVRRGLSREPEQRWPDMQTLLRELREAPIRRRTRRRIAAAIVTPLAALAAWLVLAPAAEDPCLPAQHEIDTVWNDDRRADIEAFLGASELTWARDNGRRVVEQVDHWSQRWTQARVEVCEAEQIDPSPLVERQQACLDQRRSELDQLLTLFASADPAMQAIAQSSVLGLADPLACEQIALAGVGIDPPPLEHAREVARVRGELAQVEALLLGGRWTDALKLGDALLEQALAIGYPPLEAEVRFARGRALLELGPLQASRAEFERAVDLAEAARHDHLTIAIWMALADRVAPLTNDASAGEGWFRRMRARVQAARRESEYAGELALVEGHLTLLRGDPVAAEVPLRRALEQFEAHGRRVAGARARRILAIALDRAARYDDAIVQYRTVASEIIQLYGPNHPKVADASYDLGIALQEQGRAEEARAELDRALAIWAEAPELSKASLLDGYLVLAMLEFQEDRLEQAEQHARAAETLALEQTDDNPLALAQVAAALGAIHYHGGEFELAETEFERAANGFEAAFGTTDPTVIQTRVGHGWAATLAGHPERGLEAFERVRPILPELGTESVQAISARLGLASSRLLLGQGDAALRELDGLPATLESFNALQRELIRAFAGPVDAEALARIRTSAETLSAAPRREFDAMLARFETPRIP